MNPSIRVRQSLLLALTALLFPFALRAQQAEPPTVDKSLLGLRLSMLAYLEYSAGAMPLGGDTVQNYNRFAVTRGYLTVKKTIGPRLSGRLTLDVRQENQAPGTKLNGSYVARLKYLYAEMAVPDLGPVTGIKAELGMGHVPWLDFEEQVNPYRAQGPMAMERAGLMNSADLGASLRGSLGGELADAEAKTGSRANNGRYGSWHLGIYNGGGYAATEKNQNKVLEGRLSLRLLPDLLPGLQLSYFGLTGEGNTPLPADPTAFPLFSLHLGMISLQLPSLVVAGQYFSSRGNQDGTWLNPSGGSALVGEGWSAFADWTLPGAAEKFSLFGRYDWFNPDREKKYADDTEYALTMGGLAYELSRDNLILLAYEDIAYGENSGGIGKAPIPGLDLGRENRFQAIWQVSF